MTHSSGTSRWWRATAVFVIAAVALALAPLAGPVPESYAEVQPVTPTAESAIAAVKLTPAGYRRFRDGINRSLLPFSTRFVEFDRRRVPIRQGPSKVFVWHFSAYYSNRDGASATPVGFADTRRLVRSMATRGNSYGDRRCCGVNWFVTRGGRVDQLAGLNAKLRHNPPYDSINTGVEVEAATQDGITTRQYEQLAYLTIYVLNKQRLLRDRPLRQVVRGHGEMRDAFLDRHPRSRLDPRDDFDGPVSRLLRRKIAVFLPRYPNVPPQR